MIKFFLNRKLTIKEFVELYTLRNSKTEKDSMYELSAKNDRLIWNSRKDVS